MMKETGRPAGPLSALGMGLSVGSIRSMMMILPGIRSTGWASLPIYRILLHWASLPESTNCMAVRTKKARKANGH